MTNSLVTNIHHSHNHYGRYIGDHRGEGRENMKNSRHQGTLRISIICYIASRIVSTLWPSYHKLSWSERQCLWKKRYNPAFSFVLKSSFSTHHLRCEGNAFHWAWAWYTFLYFNHLISLSLRKGQVDCWFRHAAPVYNCRAERLLPAGTAWHVYMTFWQRQGCNCTR